jgi:BirA family biotin operon repressor/biotin-[acetyl-CoA-carboxylase] ligase
MKYLRNEILRALGDNAFHSGTELGQTLGVSRAAVGKHIKALGDMGVDIYSVKGKGYRLADSISLLDVDSINAHYAQLTGVTDAACTVLSVVDSTNTYLKERTAHLYSGQSCVAEAQTAGRGRHGRVWHSPFGSSIYLSQYWQFAGGYATLSGLSLVVGVVLADVLTDMGIAGVALKWPNDVYINMHKVAGVLVEVEGTVSDDVHTVIGIGLNVDLPDDLALGQPYTSCQAHTSTRIDRNALVAQCLAKLHQALQQFAQSGLMPFMEAWERRNAFNHRGIELHLGKETIQGICMGINEQGALLVQVDGQIKAFHGGEISVRPLN